MSDYLQKQTNIIEHKKNIHQKADTQLIVIVQNNICPEIIRKWNSNIFHQHYKEWFLENLPTYIQGVITLSNKTLKYFCFLKIIIYLKEFDVFTVLFPSGGRKYALKGIFI